MFNQRASGGKIQQQEHGAVHFEPDYYLAGWVPPEPVLSLGQFLLAKIAEDDRDAWERHTVDCDKFNPPGFPCDCGYPERVARECRAKRLLVADLYIAAGNHDEVPSEFTQGRLDSFLDAARDLAVVYGQEEWRHA